MTKVITIFIYQVCVLGRLRALSSLILTVLRQDRGTDSSHFTETLSLTLSPAAWDSGLALFGYITWVLYCKGHPSESESTPHWPRPCCVWAIVLGTEGENRLPAFPVPCVRKLIRDPGDRTTCASYLCGWHWILNFIHSWASLWWPKWEFQKAAFWHWTCSLWRWVINPFYRCKQVSSLPRDRANGRARIRCILLPDPLLLASTPCCIHLNYIDGPWIWHD